MLERSVNLVFALSLGLATACGSDAPQFDPLEVDLGLECSGSDPCGGGEICLAGRCYEECDSDLQCASAESCDEGVCVVAGASTTDGGPPVTPDAGACAEVECGEQICDPATGACVDCLSSGDCAAAAPICDIAFGRCAPFQMMVVCAPCEIDDDCPGAAAGERCIARTNERVCLAPCAGGCAEGFTCRDDVCVPNIGSCTQLRLAIQRASCSTDTDCVPRASTPAPGTCGATSQCLAACSEGFACPRGFVCDDPSDGFCR